MLRGLCVQAHEMPLRAALYSHNDNWLLSADDAGLVKYWKPNLELVKAGLTSCAHSSKRPVASADVVQSHHMRHD